MIEVYLVSRQRRVAVVLAAALAGVLAVQPARAQEGASGAMPVAVSGSKALPFSDAELESALLARLLGPPEHIGEPPVARVERTSEGAVTVRVGDDTRVVQVGARTGPAAARVVALVIADLLSGRSLPVSVTPASPAPENTALAPDVAAPPVARHATPIPPVRAPRVCLTAGASKGAGTQELLAANADLDLVIPVARTPWRWSPSIGVITMPTRNEGTLEQVSFVGGVARLLGGRAWGPAELLVGPFVSAYSVGGETAHAGVLVGGEAMGRLSAPLSSGLRLVVDGRVDAYVNRVRVHWANGNAYATPRVGLSIGAGLAWDWAS
jgi:hypothetical protein